MTPVSSQLADCHGQGDGRHAPERTQHDRKVDPRSSFSSTDTISSSSQSAPQVRQLRVTGPSARARTLGKRIRASMPRHPVPHLPPLESSPPSCYDRRISIARECNGVWVLAEQTTPKRQGPQNPRRPFRDRASHPHDPDSLRRATRPCSGTTEKTPNRRATRAHLIQRSPGSCVLAFAMATGILSI